MRKWLQGAVRDIERGTHPGGITSLEELWESTGEAVARIEQVQADRAARAQEASDIAASQAALVNGMLAGAGIPAVMEVPLVQERARRPGPAGRPRGIGRG